MIYFNKQTSFFEHEGYNVVFKRYASLFFIVGIDYDEVLFASLVNETKQNELAILEFIHNFVETLDHYFKNVVCIISNALILFLV